MQAPQIVLKVMLRFIPTGYRYEQDYGALFHVFDGGIRLIRGYY